MSDAVSLIINTLVLVHTEPCLTRIKHIATVHPTVRLYSQQSAAYAWFMKQGINLGLV